MATPTKKSGDTPGKKKSSSSDSVPNYNESIAILVGPESSPTTFIVHKGTATERSEFLSAACLKNWIEGQTKTIKLPEEEPKYFNVYVHWMYTGTVKLAMLGEESAPGKWEEHIELYLLANRLDDVGLRNEVMGMINCIWPTTDKTLPSIKAIASAYDNTHTTSLLRKLLVNLFVANLKRDQVAKVAKHWPQDSVIPRAQAV